MKKKHLLRNTLIIIACMILIGIGLFIIFIHSIFDGEVKKKPLNDKYVDYICRDFHLVSLDKGESDGYHYIENELGEYCCNYYLINGEDAGQFILSRTTYNQFGAVGKYLVFQGPENDVDILKEWHVKSCEVYYIDTDDEANQGTNIFTDRQELVQNTIVTISDEELLHELLVLLGNKEEDTNFLLDSENYSYIHPEHRYYLRILFEESENIAWETRLRFYHDKTEESEWVMTLENGTPNMFYEDCGYEIQIDFDTELGKVIRDAIGHLEYDEEK